tara:strand:- start:362 stop:772 length:411 start_codon:yes stop_codon:yes gene_type:complete
VVPDSSIVPVRASPKVSATSFVAPNSNVVGDVTLDDDSAVWYGATVRGDVGAVKVGAGSSIAERAMVSGPSTIGSGVTIGSNSVLQSCTVGDASYIEPGCRCAKREREREQRRAVPTFAPPTAHPSLARSLSLSLS